MKYKNISQYQKYFVINLFRKVILIRMKYDGFRGLLLSLSMTLVVMLTSCAYYNSLYNAEKLFESAQQKPLNAQGRPNAQAIEEYNKAIRKCGYVISEYKNSKWVDDAVFLMGRAFFYRGNNQIQALEKFDELMLYYPNSPHFNQSVLYSARLKFELNEKDEAYEILRNFIQNPSYSDDHDKALLLLADLYLSEENYLQAQFYLTMLIDRFPKSKSFASAYLLLGKTFFDNENYQRSLETFTAITRSKVPKAISNDASYYIAYNQFHLKDFQRAYQTITGLIRREHRLEKINEQNILQARIMAELNRVDDAIEKLQAVVANAPRSLLSAESTFYMAEIYFLKLNDYEKAIETYNNVRRESAQSPFVERAVTRSAVVSQIVQYYRLDSNLSADKLIAEQFKLAEFYLYELSQPDSAMVIYDKIHIQREFLIVRIDSLKTYINDFETMPPSITELPEFTDTHTDSIYHESEHDFKEIFSHDEELDMLIAQAELEDEQNLKVEDEVDIEHLKELLATYENDLRLYNEEFIPQTLFVQMVVFKQFYQNEERVAYYHNRLAVDFPDNRYTESANEFMNGETITFRSRLEKDQLDQYEYAMSYYLQGNEVFQSSLAHIISILDPLTKTTVEGLSEKSKFTLGFIYYFDLGDSLTAKAYFDSLLVHAPSGEYATFTKRFYNGEHFILADRLAIIVEDDLKRAEKEEEQAKQEAERVANESATEEINIDNDSSTIETEQPPPVNDVILAPELDD